MAVTLRLGNLAAENVAFAYSPGQEVLHSLHVLADARSHPLHISWALNARRQLSPALKAELDHFLPLFAEGRLPVLWDLRESRALGSFEEDLSALRRQSPEWFREGLLECAREGTSGEAPQLSAVAAELERDPAAVLDRFCNLLEGYWNACLADLWPNLEAMFVADIERRGRRLVRLGPAGALEGLGPDARVDRSSSTCILVRRSEHDVTLSPADTLTLIPTYFAWPHLFLNPFPPHLLIAYPVLEQQAEGRAPVPPERLLKLLRAAGDMSRLQILQLVGSRPRSTGELAGLIGISEAAVSKHLKQLQEAGLVTAERQSYYVFYRAVREPVAELSRGLDALVAGETE